MKKVLFIISTLTGGGAERTVSTLSQRLSKDVECHVLLNSISPDDYPFDGHIFSLGMQPKNKKTLMYQFVAAFKRYKKIKKIKKSNQYDAVISFMESANFLNIITGKKYCKVVVSVRNNLSNEYRGLYSLVKWTAGLLYKQADIVVAVSKNVEYDLVKNIKVPREKCITIYNGYDTTQFYQRTSSVDSKNNIVFLNIGRLTYQKGQWHLIRAFSAVRKQLPNAKLIILGQGELRNYLIELIKYYQLEESVILKGFVEYPSVYLRKADCFVLTSFYEGLCNSVIEAMMNGCPSIVCNYKGANEIVAPEFTDTDSLTGIYSGQYGILVPVCSTKVNEIGDELDDKEKILAEAMIKFALGEIGSEYTSEVLRERVEYFSLNRSIESWKKVI